MKKNPIFYILLLIGFILSVSLRASDFSLTLEGKVSWENVPWNPS